MITFKEFLIEKRKNPLTNTKVSAYEQLKKYKDDPSIYLSYTSLKKLGINPKSNWNTPMGIYTYPIKEIWHKIEATKSSTGVPWASHQPYIHIIKYNGTGNLIEAETYSNLFKDIKHIREKYSYVYENSKIETIDDVIRKGMRTSVNSTDFAKFWNITHLISNDMIYVKKHSSKSMLNWSTLLRSLGYTGFSDKSGTGIIHPSEPIQTIFLSKKDITVVDMILNKDYTKAISIKSESDIEKHLPKILKKYSLNRVFNTIIKNENFIGEYYLNRITIDQIISHILQNFDFYISREDKNIDLYIALKFNDKNGFTSDKDKSLVYDQTKLYFNNYDGKQLPNRSQVELTSDAIAHYYGDLLDTLHINGNSTTFYNNTYSIFEWLYSK